MEPTAIQGQTETTKATSSPPQDRVRIVSTPGMCGGRPRIDGHRITVEDVAIWHERMGMSPDEIVSSRPTITLSDVHAALAYYYENRERIDADIEEGAKFVQEILRLHASHLPHAGITYCDKDTRSIGEIITMLGSVNENASPIWRGVQDLAGVGEWTPDLGLFGRPNGCFVSHSAADGLEALFGLGCTGQLGFHFAKLLAFGLAPPDGPGDTGDADQSNQIEPVRVAL